jgi:hypothetical protein
VSLSRAISLRTQLKKEKGFLKTFKAHKKKLTARKIGRVSRGNHLTLAPFVIYNVRFAVPIVFVRNAEAQRVGRNVYRRSESSPGLGA